MKCGLWVTLQSRYLWLWQTCMCQRYCLKNVCCHCTACSGLSELSDGYSMCTAESGVPCVCVCACVCTLSVCVCVCVYTMSVCVCVCLCVTSHAFVLIRELIIKRIIHCLFACNALNFLMSVNRLLSCNRNCIPLCHALFHNQC